MSVITYIFQRGETILIPLDAVAGNPDTVTAISAKMRKLAPGKRTLDPDAPVAATFSVSARTADGGIPAGWTLMVDDVASAALDVGTYLADAKLSVGSAKIITDPVQIQITEPATT